MEPDTTKEFDLFDKPSVKKGLYRALWVACILSMLPTIIFPDTHHHTHFGENPRWPSYAILGFIACSVMIIVAKLLGYVLKRKDDYWGVVESETLPEDVDESIR